MSINRFIRLILKHSKLIIAITIAVTVFLGWKALSIEINTDVNMLMPTENERIKKIKTELDVDKEVLNYMYLSIYGSDIYDLEILGIYQDTIDKILEFPEIELVLTPFNFVFFESRAKRIIPTTISPTGRAPVTAEELEIFTKRAKDNALSKNFVVGDNGRILTAVFISTAVDKAEDFIAEFNAAVVPLKKAVNVHHTGEVAFQERVAFYLLKDFTNLLKLAVFAMLMIFGLSFRSLRAIILPILVVVIGAIWTLGVMAVIGFKITVLTVVIPSMVLAIGSSYTIHILNEYFRIGRETGMDKITWLADAVEHVLKTIIVAALTTIVSFMSLLTTTLQPLREFGLAISMGIFFCAVLALFFLPTVFCVLKTPSLHHGKRVSEGWLTKAVGRLGLCAHHSSSIVLGMFILLLALFLLCYPYILHQSDYFSYFPTNDPLIISSRFINEHNGGSQTLNLTLKAANGEKNFFLDPKVLKKIDKLETILSVHPSVTSKLSFTGILRTMNKVTNGSDTIPESRGLIVLLYRYFGLIPKDKVTFGQDSTIINEDASQITIYLKLAEAGTYSMINEVDMKKFLDFVNKETSLAIDDSIEKIIWGNTLLVLDSSRTLKRDQFRSTILSIVFGMIITWIFFRSFVYSLIAMIPLLSGIFLYFINLYLFNIPLDMTTIIVTNVTVGVGLDDAVHFILQYRQQRKQKSYQEALKSTLEITGRPIVLTTFSLAAGLIVLCFASFKPVVFFGFLIAGTLFSTMIGSIVFIPSFITYYEKIRKRENHKP